MGSSADNRSNGHSTAQSTTVIVVGAGFAGMGTAIECTRRGMKATVIEKYLKSNQYGGEQHFASSFVNDFNYPLISDLRHHRFLPKWMSSNEELGQRG